MVQRLFSLPQRPTPNDVADALAIAVTGVYRAPQLRKNGSAVLEGQR